LKEYCEKIPFRKIFALAIVRNRFLRRFELQVEDFLEPIYPLVNSEVLSTICSLPQHFRLNKRMQRLILLRYFPKLYRIPYAMSLLPPVFPHFIHRSVNNAAQQFYVKAKLNRPCPLISNSQYHFFRSNLHLFRPLLMKYLPPFFKSRQIDCLINNLNPKSARLLNRIVAYSILCEELNLT
jgi:hypothetical protein